MSDSKPPSPAQLERLIQAFNDGQPDASGRLFSELYDQLRVIARYHLQREAGSATLSPTALVHETYLRFTGREIAELKDNQHFLSLMARVMRQWMIDRARRLQSQKRGQRPMMETFVEDRISSDQDGLDPTELLALDRALSALQARDAEMARIVEFRYFMGFSIAETAQAMNVSARSVARRWQAARAWLLVEMKS
ncbi:MAG: ECF-type sigma factor [Pseudomonadota bacterium]